ncbi:MAG: lamin tail domain-containing protein [Verrucomicrobiales bacterium]|nr:lamin tail domain-containing protein [Verrucomicrobiales bacterium]
MRTLTGLLHVLLPHLLLAALLAGFQAAAQPSSGLLREVYEGIGGTAVSDLTSAPSFPNSPTSTGYVTDAFEAPTDVLENYGQRLRGYLVPPVTGNYTFWIASDDGGELWLSTTASPAGRTRIATVNGWTSSREWTREGNQQSAPIPLKSGQIYYVEALMKEGGGGDNLAVRWLRPDGVDEAPIPGSRLLPWGVTLSKPRIVREPQNTAAVEGLSARFDVQVDPLGPSLFQWLRNGEIISGATNSVLEYSPVSLADHNARFSVSLTNQYGAALSAEAVLTVTPDTTRPVPLLAENRNAQTVRIQFSEPVSEASIQRPGSFRISGGGSVLSASLDPDGRNVRLAVSPLNFGAPYELTINHVTDRAGTPNAVTPDTVLRFTALEYVPTDLGNPAISGGVVRIGPGSFNVRGAGSSFGRSTDEVQFAAEERTGDFDIQVRLAGLDYTDAFLRAGLMARERMDSNARYAAVFSGSSSLGCFFESRNPAGSVPVPASIRGGFPSNGPETWLRLRRSGNTFTGFSSLDGRTWTSLGSVTLASAPATLFFGMAVSSQNPGQATTALFRDLGPAVQTTVGPLVRDREPPGPFVRATGLVFSEIMYHPRGNRVGPVPDLEFLEIHNTGAIFEDLSGAHLMGEVEYTFPSGTVIPSGGYLVVAADPAALESASGIRGVLGPYSGHLPNEGGVVGLRAKQGDTLFEVGYGTSAPWPVAADGAGHSLTLARPSYGPSDPRAWFASVEPGGTPGGPEVLRPEPLAALRINELLAHTDDPQVDFVEVFNAGNSELDLAGCILTDDIQTNRFRIPPGPPLAPRSHRVFDQNALGFRLKAAGETLFLIRPDGGRVLDAVRFGAQENGVSFGRQPDGAESLRRLAQPTPGAANASWRREEVVISELMYHPISDDDRDEYLELHNRSERTLDLGGWRFTSGIGFEFPPGTQIPPAGDLVVAKDPVHLRAKYPQLNSGTVFGGYSGTLSDRGERIALARPDDIQSTNDVGVISTSRIYIDIAEVTYLDGGSWGTWSDGGGSSLELTDLQADPLQASNWADSDESAKGSWTEFSLTGRLDNGNTGFPPNQLQVTLQGGGEVLVDDVGVFRSDSQANLLSNPGFESGSGATASGWTFQGNHAESSVQSTDAAAGTRCLHIRTQARGDTGFNRIRTPLSAGLSEGASATIRAKVRWVRGWPEVLFRIRGNWLEMPVAIPVPENLGSPGLPNSRRVDNAGPSISEVTHVPALPAANESVLITARVADPDGISAVRVLGRVDGSASTVSQILRDDGTLGDAVAGDGLYSGTLPGRASGAVVAFRVEATDGAAAPGNSKYPADHPAHECLIRWGDAVPFGTFGHYHLWTSAATRNARNASSPLNNLFRDSTFVYGNSRVIYGAGFKDKGSPFKGGAGDWYVALPEDQPLLGAGELVLASTGNNGSDTTNLREQVCFSIARALGAGYLHRRYIRLYVDGGQFRDIMEDSEEPNGDYASRFFSEGDHPELYKIEDWFEFQDDGTSFGNVDATLERFTTPPGVSGAPLKPARYRWSWRKRAIGDSANNFTNLLRLVEAANAPASSYPASVLESVDVDQWMRTFAFERIVGNWDSYGMGRGKNMYAYRRDGLRWKLFPWDVDFALDGGGNGPTDSLWGAGDPAINRMFDDFTIRRRLWQAYLDAVNGPLLPEQVAAQVTSRAEALRNNGVPTSDNTGARTYLEVRRQTILNAIKANDVPALEITSNGGRDVVTGAPSVVLTGKAPLALAGLAVNGVPYPVQWTGYTTWRMTVPLSQQTNQLQITGVDRFGSPLSGYSDTVQVISTGLIPKVEDFVALNEIQYDPLAPNTSFVELANTSTSTPFDLSEFRLDGVGYTFPSGSILAAGGYWVLARDRAAFASAYGPSIPVFGVFPGSLDNDGERLSLVKPDPSGGTNETLVDVVRYGNRYPWPTNAAGRGPSLQKIDPAQDGRRPGNWAATAPASPGSATPGARNSVQATLPQLTGLWINEVLPNNVSGPVDNASERDPYVELYNAGADAVDLAEFFLTDDPALPEKWRFPSGTTLEPRQFLVVWTDGQVSQSAPGSPHASFRPAPQGGGISLIRRLGNPAAPAVMDHVDYGTIGADRSFGSYPDGDPLERRYFDFVTPGASNNPAIPEVRITINEFMAANTATLADPADGGFEDWFELFNAGTQPADLSGYYLTDSFANWNQYRIPSGVIVPPGGYLLVWADGEPGQNTVPPGDLHVNFRLSATREAIGLYDPNGRLVDGFEYSDQKDDVSTGRFPDGAADTLLELDTPTPRGPNAIQGGNLPPVLNPIGNREVAEQSLLQFRVLASDPNPQQTLRYGLGADAPPGATIEPDTGLFTWTPTESQGPGIYAVTFRVTDSGTPARTTAERIQIAVTESNTPPLMDSIADQSVDEGSTLTFSLTATDPDLPRQTLSYSLLNAPPGAVLDEKTGDFRWTPSEAQGPGIYPMTLRVTDDGSPPLQGERVVTISVREVDNAPEIVRLAPITLREGQRLVVTNRAADPDSPPAPLRFSLPAGAPEGVAIDSTTGVLTWNTREQDGPASHELLIRVTQAGAAALSDQFLLGITVEEDNQPPILDPIGDISVEEGDLVSVTARAQDADLPPQALTYSVEALGTTAQVDAVTGLFQWQTDPDAGASTNQFILRVTDGGPDARTASQPFTVITVPRFQVLISEVMHRPAAARSEYVEISNPSARTPWDLGGLVLAGNQMSFHFPEPFILNPGSAVCVVRDLTAFRSAYGSIPVVAGVWTGDLGADGDHLHLRLPSDGSRPEGLDEFRYEAAAPWPVGSRENGASLQVIDVRRDNSRVGNWSSATTYDGPRSLVSMTNEWRYHQSGPLASPWRLPDYPDATWPTGRGLLYVETSALPAPKSTELTLGQNTYYFRTEFNLPTVPSGARLVLNTIVDDGVVLYLNGKELHRQNIDPASVVDFNTPASLVDNATLTGPFVLPADLLEKGRNVLAAEVHQVSGTSSDIVFGCSLDLEGGSVPAFTPGSSNNVALALPEFPPVWITEIQPRNAHGVSGTDGVPRPWIELANRGDTAVSLAGWTLSNSAENPGLWTFPAGAVLPPNSHTILFADARPEATTPGEWHAGFSLDPVSGLVLISRPQPGGIAIVDYLRYSGVPEDRSAVPDPEGPAGSSRVTDPSPESSGSPNLAPVVDPVAGLTATPGVLLRFTISASDPDPSQSLTFSLVSGPANLTVSPSGLVQWNPMTTQVGSVVVRIRVRDDGIPRMSTDLRVTIDVTPPRTAVMTIQLDGTVPEIVLPSIPGIRYRVESSDSLNPPAWNLLRTVDGTGSPLVISDPGASETTRRYYRAVVP